MVRKLRHEPVGSNVERVSGKDSTTTTVPAYRDGWVSHAVHYIFGVVGVLSYYSRSS